MKKLTPLFFLALASCGSSNNTTQDSIVKTDSVFIDIEDSIAKSDSIAIPQDGTIISVEQPAIEEENTEKVSKREFSLEKTKWKLVEFNGKKIGTKGNETPYIILDPEGSKLNGHSGCNNFNGTYKLEEGLRISFGPIMVTKMYCENNMVNESAFLHIFEQVDNYSIYENSLSLSKARMAPFARFKAE